MQTSQQGVTVDMLFSVDVQYQVPRYQRRYVWDEANWRTLWDDILSRLDLELVENKDGQFVIKHHEQRDEVPENQDGPHFTGPFVTRPTGGRGILSRFEVIDGQQRLTTFQIILCVIRDICESKDYNEFTGEVAIAIENKAPVIKRSSSASFDPTYKFCPTDYDRPAFEKIAEGKYGEIIPAAFDEANNCLQPKLIKKVRAKVFNNLEGISDNILKAYEYFYEQIRGYVGASYDYDKVDNLISAIKYDFTLVQITLDASDQSEKIFESLNATGRKLSEFDYLRNNLFLRAGKLGIDQESNRPYSDIFYDKHWHFENHFRYWNEERLESFFRAFLMSKLGPFCFGLDKEDIKNKKAFEVYQNQYYRQVKDKGIEHEFSELDRYAKVYQEMDDYDSGNDRPMQFYDDLKIPSLLSFIMHLKNETKIPDSDLEQVFRILESYIVRRMVNYGHGANDEDEQAYFQINGFFSRLIDGEKFSLKNFARSLQTWPNDARIPQGLQQTMNETFYGKRSARNSAWFLLRYILYRIERHISKKDNLHFNNFLASPTRIMPAPQRNRPEWRDQRDDWLGIGNLTFRARGEMTQNQVNNLSPKKTIEILSESSNASLALNREICQIYQDAGWGVSQIRERKERLHTYFCEIWPDSNSSLTAPKTIEWHNGVLKQWHPNFSKGHIIDDQGNEIYVDKSQFRPSDIPSLQKGTKLKFEKISAEDGFKAINVTRI